MLHFMPLDLEKPAEKETEQKPAWKWEECDCFPTSPYFTFFTNVTRTQT